MDALWIVLLALRFVAAASEDSMMNNHQTKREGEQHVYNLWINKATLS